MLLVLSAYWRWMHNDNCDARNHLFCAVHMQLIIYSSQIWHCHWQPSNESFVINYDLQSFG